MDLGPLPIICTIIVTDEYGGASGQEDWGAHPLLSLPQADAIISVDHEGRMTELSVVSIATSDHHAVPVVHATRVRQPAG